jgi:hypothetical protein
MDFHKFRTQLDELSQFFGYLEQRFTPEELSELDRETLMAYVRDLYKSFFVAAVAAPNPQLPPQTQHIAPIIAAEKTVEPVIETIVEPVIETPIVAELPQIEIIETIQEIPTEETEETAEIFETVEEVAEIENIDEKIAEITQEVENQNAVILLPEVVEQPPTTQETGMVIHLGTDLQAQQIYRPEIVLNTVVDDEMFEQHETRFNPDYDVLFYIKDSKELSQKLADSRIDDLNKAMGLNDKFLYINELFGGNAARFKIAIDYFNQEAKSLNDARTYIERELIETFKWVTPLKSDLSKQFIKLLRRRYLK